MHLTKTLLIVLSTLYVLLFTPLSAHAAPPNKAPDPSVTEYRVIGLTAATSDGSIDAPVGAPTHRGTRAFTSLCAAEYGPAARAATVEDWLRTPGSIPLPPADGPVAWIAPGPITLTYIADTGVLDWRASIDAQPAFAYSTFIRSEEAVRNLSCTDWHLDTPGSGLSIFRNTGLLVTVQIPCSTVLPLLCAAPVIVGVP